MNSQTSTAIDEHVFTHAMQQPFEQHLRPRPQKQGDAQPAASLKARSTAFIRV